MIKLYDTKLSGNAWKVRLVLRYLGMEFERETISLPNGDQKTESFTALNPFQRVPVVIFCDGTVGSESGGILLQLAQGTDLMPTDPALHHAVMSWMFFEQADLMRFLAYPRFFQMTGQTEAQADVIAHYHEIAHAGLSRIEDTLEHQTWIVGDSLSIADFALYPYINLGPEGGLNLSVYPNILAWMKRFESLKNFEPIISKFDA